MLQDAKIVTFRHRLEFLSLKCAKFSLINDLIFVFMKYHCAIMVSFKWGFLFLILPESHTYSFAMMT